MPQSGPKRQPMWVLHRILDIPGSEPASESQFGGIGQHLEGCRCTLQKCREACEIRDAEPPRRRVLVVLKFLKPPAHIELMDSPDDLEPVCEGEQISAVPCAGRVIWTRRRDCRLACRCCAGADHNAARSLPAHKRRRRGICGERERIQSESCPRETHAEGIQNAR